MQVFIALGSNLDNPLRQVESACDALANHHAMSLIRRSPWYRSRAVGPPQPDYINGVVEIETALQPEPLLDQLQQMEQNQRRVRTQQWGPRTLDLDILLYADWEIQSERLTVPHPHMRARNFVLQPLCDIAPRLSLPNGPSIASLLTTVGTAGLSRMADGSSR